MALDLTFRTDCAPGTPTEPGKEPPEAGLGAHTRKWKTEHLRQETVEKFLQASPRHLGSSPGAEPESIQRIDAGEAMQRPSRENQRQPEGLFRRDHGSWIIRERAPRILRQRDWVELGWVSCPGWI